MSNSILSIRRFWASDDGVRNQNISPNKAYAHLQGHSYLGYTLTSTCTLKYSSEMHSLQRFKEKSKIYANLFSLSRIYAITTASPFPECVFSFTVCKICWGFCI